MNRPGFISLLTVILVGAVASSVALIILFSGVTSSKTSFSVTQSAQAKAAANACAELALGVIQANITTPTPTTNSYTIDINTKAQCDYSITGVAPNYSVNSTGTVDATGKNIKKRVSVTLNQVGPTLNIASWQEVP
ncbi:hypothetical protein H0W80_02940 [Candidatus Saccharibacteria bacterium]|nr:hypothetical protein [Candidatus Saccharibacteria bacterium]